MDPAVVHRRRWLDPRCARPERLPRRGRQHHRQRGPPHPEPRARRVDLRAPVDRRRLRPGVRRPAPARRRPRGPLRPQGRHAGRPGAVRRHLGAGRLRHGLGPADRRPRRHGRRRRAGLPGHPGHPHQRVHRPSASGPRPSASGRRCPGWRWRSVPSPAGSCSSTSGGARCSSSTSPSWSSPSSPAPSCSSRPRGTPRRAASTCSGTVLSIAAIGLLVFTVIEGPTVGLDLAHHPARLRRRRRSCSPPSSAGSCGWPNPLLDVRVFRVASVQCGGGRPVAVAFFGLFGFIFLVTQYFQFVRGYSTLVGGCAHAAVRHLRRHHRPDRARLALRFGPRRVVSRGLVLDVGRAWWRPASSTPTRLLGPVVVSDGAARHRALPRHRPGHRGDHGLAAEGEGRRRLGGQRHHPGARRHPGRGRGRQRVRLGLRADAGGPPRGLPDPGRRPRRRRELGGRSPRRGRTGAGRQRRGPSPRPLARRSSTAWRPGASWPPAWPSPGPSPPGPSCLTGHGRRRLPRSRR